MKKIFLSVISIVLVLGISMLFNACTEYDDLMTSDVELGGLITCTGTFPYKLNATPQVNVEVDILTGPEITSVEVWNSFSNKVAGEESNEVLLNTLDVSGANETGDVSKAFAVTYSDLTAGLTFATWSFPADESDLNIGDAWTLKYVSIMSDGRKVTNTNATTISVANFFAGPYVSTVWYDHPTAGLQTDNIDYDKDLLALSSDECETYMAVFSDRSLFIKIDQATNTVSIKSAEDDDAIHDIAEGVNSYDPATGIIDLWYGYTRANGTRKLRDYLVPE